jgi:hypothetical protein
VQSHTSLGRTLGPFIGGNKVLFGVNEGNRGLDRHENVVSDMVSPLYWFLFYDSGKENRPTKRGVALHFGEWKELKQIIPLLEEREPELKQLVPLYITDLINKS